MQTSDVSLKNYSTLQAEDFNLDKIHYSFFSEELEGGLLGIVCQIVNEVIRLFSGCDYASELKYRAVFEALKAKVKIIGASDERVRLPHTLFCRLHQQLKTTDCLNFLSWWNTSLQGSIASEPRTSPLTSFGGSCFELLQRALREKQDHLFQYYVRYGALEEVSPASYASLVDQAVSSGQKESARELIVAGAMCVQLDHPEKLERLHGIEGFNVFVNFFLQEVTESDCDFFALDMDTYDLSVTSLGSAVQIGIQQRNDDPKLIIWVDRELRSRAIFWEGEAASVIELLREDSPSRAVLDESISGFLKMFGFDQDAVHMSLHRSLLFYQPEFILSQMQNKQVYSFFNDWLEFEDAIDGGGPEQEFLTLLARAVFHRFDSNLPRLSEQASDDEKILLQNIGRKLFYPAWKREKIVLGRVVDDRFFDAVEAHLKYEELTDSLRVDLVAKICGSKELECVFQAYRGEHPFLSEDVSRALVDILSVTEPVPEDFSGYKRFVETVVLGELDYEDVLRAAAHVTKALWDVASRRDKANLILAPPQKLKNTIQGKRLLAKDVSSRVVCSSSNKVVQDKTKWLQEALLKWKQKGLEEFVFALTGAQTLAADKVFNVAGTDEAVCQVFSCTQDLYVPRVHTGFGFRELPADASNREKFLNSLKLTLAEKSYSMS